VFAIVGLSNPIGLAFDNSGNLYAANGGNNTIEKFAPNGTGSLFANTGNDPTGLAFDSGGNLFVVDQLSNMIEKFTPGGAESVFATGLNQPTFIAIQIPEPSIVGLLGLGILGLARFRRSLRIS